MSMAKATTVRLTDEMFARLDQASARTGMPVNSIVIAACLEWMQRHTPAPPDPRVEVAIGSGPPFTMVPPRWSTISRAVKRAVGQVERPGMYPFERFTDHAKEFLTKAQGEAEKAGFSYIGTEHMLLAAFGNPEFHSAHVLKTLGVEESAVRLAIQNAIGRAPRFPQQSIVPTSRVKKVIETAFALRAAGITEGANDRVGTHHILLGLAVEGEGIAAHVLSDLGATRKRIEAEVGKLTEPEP
jgi:Clp amino terminal domain, pathogenicity island component